MTDVNFLDLFKASFTFYVESGMKKKIEADIDTLTNQGGPATKEFEAACFEFVIEHFLRKFYCL